MGEQEPRSAPDKMRKTSCSQEDKSSTALGVSQNICVDVHEISHAPARLAILCEPFLQERRRR